ncbi:hypothetical protein I6A84_36320 [Frankia sp. CNm7]|uniref:Uncharacterized protein n=1 Tax=Frankia nepalensis TaxID=1836974 RepID=A0A937RCJ9_9ACTN|nr:hypothetical protein [Frankia nepalensis]MBL7494715.1 hypothetical protein [Frankia nepalensis]MBL7514136.1 hypothetical protein [Frankia nepalensis]MBL7523378.1 hypothetical protein [Frankia nepalensis]MBL7626500.1 hypothetical protein [Frankia nepalensis]
MTDKDGPIVFLEVVTLAVGCLAACLPLAWLAFGRRVPAGRWGRGRTGGAPPR